MEGSCHESGIFVHAGAISWPQESEWEREADRSSPDYIRWVQSSLNRAEGLRLAVDGILGPATRSAIRQLPAAPGAVSRRDRGTSDRSQVEGTLRRAIVGQRAVRASAPASAGVPHASYRPCRRLAGLRPLPARKWTTIDHFAEAKGRRRAPATQAPTMRQSGLGYVHRHRAPEASWLLA